MFVHCLLAGIGLAALGVSAGALASLARLAAILGRLQTQQDDDLDFLCDVARDLHARLVRVEHGARVDPPHVPLYKRDDRCPRRDTD